MPRVRNPGQFVLRRLSSTFNFILCGKTPLQRSTWLSGGSVSVCWGYSPTALATPEAVLSSDEKEGVAVVDIGGGVTDVAVYYRGVPRYVATIPMGAAPSTRTSVHQSIPEKHVESLKCKYGSAVAELAPEDKLIRVSGRGHEAKDILLRNLATVIEAPGYRHRQFVQQEVRDSGVATEQLAYGIVLTGGSAQLKDIDELFRRVTGMDDFVSQAPKREASAKIRARRSRTPFATVVGLLLKGPAWVRAT